MRYAIFESSENKQEIGGALVRMDEAKPGIGGVLIYFATEEINTALNRVEAAGGKVIRRKLNVGDFGYIALIEDTEGNMIGLHAKK
jgi:predicted enzyme related to lactoylglutathione lyase